MTNLKNPQTPGNADQGAPGPTANVGGGNGPQPVAPPSPLHIRLDRQDIDVDPTGLHDGTLTGRQIRELATPPIAADRDLFEIVPGGSDRKIGDGDTVEIRDHVRFFSAPRNINPGTAGPLTLSLQCSTRDRCQRSVRDAAQ